MSEIYGCMMRGNPDREVTLGSNDRLDVVVNVGSAEDSRRFIYVVVEDMGDHFICRVDGNEIKILDK